MKGERLHSTGNESELNRHYNNVMSNSNDNETKPDVHCTRTGHK